MNTSNAYSRRMWCGFQILQSVCLYAARIYILISPYVCKKTKFKRDCVGSGESSTVSGARALADLRIDEVSVAHICFEKITVADNMTLFR